MSTPAPIRILEWQFMAYKRLWRANVVASFLQPMLYLLAIGFGVGALVNRNAGSAEMLGNVRYATFVAPGLLVTTAMMVASVESMWPIVDGLVWSRLYDAMTATPLEPVDIVSAHALWVLFRTGIATMSVAAAMALFPSVRSWGLLLAVPAAMLAGLAFGMPIGAWSVTRRGDSSFPVIQRFVITPLFLFGGAFFPLTQLPVGIRWFGYSTPLWHGVQLCRSWAGGGSSGAAATLGHIGYLVLWAVAGTLVMRHFARKRLLP